MFGHTRDDLVENIAFDHESRTSRATLTMVKKDCVGRAGDGRFEVTNIFKDDVGRFPAELEANFLQVPGSGVYNHFAHFGGTGKSHFVDIGMGGKRAAGGFAES